MENGSTARASSVALFRFRRLFVRGENIRDDCFAFRRLQARAWPHPVNNFRPAICRVMGDWRQDMTFDAARCEDSPPVIQSFHGSNGAAHLRHVRSYRRRKIVEAGLATNEQD